MGFAVLALAFSSIFITKLEQREVPPLVHLTGGTRLSLVACAMVHSVTLFMLTLIPLAFGIGFGHPTMASLVSLVAQGDEQGRVQGAAGAIESLGRTIGPVWGNASLEQFGEATPYVSAAALLALTLVVSMGLKVGDRHEIADAVGP